MITSSIRRVLSVSIVLSCASACFGQGLYWESSATGGPQGDTPRASKTFAMPGKFRREDENMIVIVRIDKETMYLLRPKDKTYSEMTFAEMESTMKGANEQMAAQMEAMKKRLKDLPPEQRSAFEKKLADNPLFKDKDAKESKVEMATLGEKKSLLGHECVRYIAKQDGKEILSAWTAKDIKEFDSLRKDWIEISKRMNAMNPMLGKGIGAAFEQVDGLPLETEMSGVKTVVTKVEPRKTPDADFDVPAGYAKGKSPFERALGPATKVPPKKNE